MSGIKGLAWALVLATAGLARGQAVVEEVAPAASDVGMQRVSQILGSTVHLQGADGYGKVEDLVLDRNGAVSHLVVANNGQYAMLPWNAANYNYGQRVATYNVTPEAVQPLLFKQNAWPNAADPQYMTRVQKVFPGKTVVREGATPVGDPVVKEKVKVKPNGDVKVKEKVR